MDNPSTIIFVEDNPSDLRLFKYALDQVQSDIGLTHYEHGRAFLEALPAHYPSSIYCILLDLNMPFISGMEVIEQIKKMPDYSHIPIIVFTSTNTNEEKQKAYGLGANAYVQKPLEIDDLVIVVQRIIDFWVNVNDRVA